MKVLIVYHSHSGNTASVVHDCADLLRDRYKAEVETEKLKYQKGKNTIINRLFYRFTHRFITLAPTTKDISDFDILILGIPVFGGRPSAAMSKYLDLLNGKKNIKIILGYVYGFEANAKKCSRYVESVLAKKKQKNVSEFFVPWTEVLDKELIKKKIRKVIADII